MVYKYPGYFIQSAALGALYILNSFTLRKVRIIIVKRLYKDIQKLNALVFSNVRDNSEA